MGAKVKLSDTKMAVADRDEELRSAPPSPRDEEGIWLLGSSISSEQYDREMFHRDEDEFAVKQAKVFLDDAIKYRSIQHGIDPIALKLYRVYYSRPMKWGYGVLLAIIMLLAFFEYPSSLSLTSDTRAYPDQSRLNPPCGLTESIELVCFAFFSADILLQLRLLGWRRFIKRPWIIAYVLTVSFSIADIFVSLGFCPSDYEIYPYRIRRLLRPILFIQASSVMKKMVNAIKKTLPEIFSVLFLLAMHLYLFTMIGMLLFWPQCDVSSVPDRNASLPNSTTGNDSNVSLANSATVSSSNVSTSDSTEGKKYFSDLGSAIVHMIVLLSTANHPDIMMPAYSQNRLYSIYFIAFVVIGLYVIMNVLTAVVYNRFRGYLASSFQASFRRRRVAQFAAFAVLANRTQQSHVLRANQLQVDKSYVRLLLQEVKVNKNQVALMSEKLETLDSDMLSWSQFREVFNVLQDSSSERKQQKPQQYARYRLVGWIRFILKHRFFTYFSLLISFLNCVVISLVVIYRCQLPAVGTNVTVSYILGVINFAFIFYYVLEAGMNVVFLGKSYFLKLANIFDFVTAFLIVCGDIALMIAEGSFDASVSFKSRHVYVSHTALVAAQVSIQITDIFIIIRMLRIIPHIPALKRITITIFHLFKNLRAYIGLMVCVYYFFAILGMMTFERVTFHPTDAEANECGTYQEGRYYANNFKDFYASLVVLYDVMVVNNWHIYLRAYGTAFSPSPWPQIFFVLWWLVASVIGISLFVALLLEAFITKWEAANKVQKEKERDVAVAAPGTSQGLEEESTMNEDVVDLLRGELKELSDEELVSELLSHGDLQLKY